MYDVIDDTYIGYSTLDGTSAIKFSSTDNASSEQYNKLFEVQHSQYEALSRYETCEGKLNYQAFNDITPDKEVGPEKVVSNLTEHHENLNKNENLYVMVL